MQILVWDSATNVYNRKDLFPVLTPAFPSGNSAFNVSRASRDVMIREFKLGFEKVRRVLVGSVLIACFSMLMRVFTLFGPVL